MNYDVFKIIEGNAPLPSHMYIGPDCIHNHGKESKTIRYIKSDVCITCSKNSGIKHEHKKGKYRDITALHTYEEIQEDKIEKEYWDNE